MILEWPSEWIDLIMIAPVAVRKKQILAAVVFVLPSPTTAVNGEDNSNQFVFLIASEDYIV